MEEYKNMDQLVVATITQAYKDYETASKNLLRSKKQMAEIEEFFSGLGFYIYQTKDGVKVTYMDNAEKTRAIMET